MSKIIKSQTEKVNLVSTGSLTNSALLLKTFPEVKENLEQISIMGGGIYEGNITPNAEFNIFLDPEASEIVFNSGVPIVLVPLEVTHTALCTPEIFETIENIDSNYSKIIMGILNFFKNTYKDTQGFESPPVHDPCAMAFISNPEIFEGELVRIDIEKNSMFCDGKIIINHRVGFDQKILNKNTFLTKKMNVEMFWKIMIESIIKANSLSQIN